MHVQVKMITGIWQNDKDSSPLQYQFVADPLKPWHITALNELHTFIVTLHPAKVHCEGYMASPRISWPVERGNRLPTSSIPSDSF